VQESVDRQQTIDALHARNSELESKVEEAMRACATKQDAIDALKASNEEFGH